MASPSLLEIHKFTENIWRLTAFHAAHHPYGDSLVGDDREALPLKLVRKILSNSQELRKLCLVYSRDLFKRASPETLLAALYDEIHTMTSMIVPGPVIIVSGEALFRRAAADILCWQLQNAPEKSPIPKTARSFLARSPRFPAYVIIPTIQ